MMLTLWQYIGVIILFVIVFLGLMGWLAYTQEKNAWNGGKCRYCGKDWNKFFVSKEGSRYYECAGHLKILRIRFDVDK